MVPSLFVIYEAIYISWYCGHWHINKKIDRMHFLMECKESLPIEAHNRNIKI